MLRRIFGALFAIVMMFVASSALAEDWQGSLLVRARQKNVGLDRSEIIAGGSLATVGKEFTVVTRQYSDLPGSLSGKKLRLRATELSHNWAQSVLDALSMESLDVVKASGSGSTGKRWRLKLSFSAKRVNGSLVKGTIQCGALRTKVVASATTEIALEGGSATLKTGESVVVDPGFFAQPATLEVWIQKDPLEKSADVLIASDTLVLRFSKGLLATQNNQDVGLVIVRAPGKIGKKSFRVAPTQRQAVARIVISSGEESKTLYGYSGRDLRISNEELAMLIDAGDPKTTIAITEIDMEKFLAEQVTLELFHWNERDQKFDSLPSWSPSVLASGEQTVVMLHGWQAKGDGASLHPQVSTWEPLLKWATGTTAGSAEWSRNAANFDFYAIRYDTRKSIYENAALIQNRLAQNFGNRPIVLLGHSMGGLIGHVMYQKYHPTDPNAYLPWDNGGGIVRLVTLGTPFHGSPLVTLVDEHIDCTLWLDDNLVDASDLKLKLETPGALSLRWDQLDGRNVGSPNNELAQLNDGLPESIPEYRTFAGVLSSENHPYKYKSGNKRLITCYPEHAGDGVVPEISAHLKRFVDGAAVARTTEVKMSGPGYDSDFDHSQLWKGRFGEAFDAMHFSAIVRQLDLWPDYLLTMDTAQDAYYEPAFEIGFSSSPESLLVYARNSGYNVPRYPVMIVRADGDSTPEEIFVEIEILQTGSGGTGENIIGYASDVDPDKEIALFRSTVPGKTILKLKTNFPYSFHVVVIGGSMKFQNEMRIHLPK